MWEKTSNEWNMKCRSVFRRYETQFQRYDMSKVSYIEDEKSMKVLRGKAFFDVT